MRGVVFDFNGTLVFDQKQQEAAWTEFARRYAHRQFSRQDFERHVFGQNNRQALLFLLGPNQDEVMVARYSAEKDRLYRKLCDQVEGYSLAPGAERLFNLLKTSQIPFTIATGSIESNVNYYFDRLNLQRWFTKAQVVWDDGYLKSKPDPDAFIKSAQRLHVSPRDLIVFEDSASGISAALRAHCKSVFEVVGEGIKTPDSGLDGLTRRISDFRGITLPDILRS